MPEASKGFKAVQRAEIQSRDMKKGAGSTPTPWSSKFASLAHKSYSAATFCVSMPSPCATPRPKSAWTLYQWPIIRSWI